jgi:PKD repeat protein
VVLYFIFHTKQRRATKKNGHLDLTGNAAPSSTGITHAKNLTARGWKVQTSTKNNPPGAAFSMSKSSGKALLTVYFTDKSTGTITSEKWVFGDGATSTLKNPSHKFTKVGKFKVVLTVGNGVGSSSKYQYVTVTK